MTRKYSLAHLTALKCSTPELVRIAAQAGYDYISPRLVNLGVAGEMDYDLTKQPKLFRDTVTAMEETGVGVHDIELFRIIDNVDLKSYEPAMEVGRKLGARHILSSIWTSNKEYYTEKFAQLCDLAAQYDMTVNVEFVTWAEVFDLKTVLELLQTVKRKNVGVMVDTLHAYRSRVAPEDLKQIPAQWINFCHICDGPAEIPTDKADLIYVGRDAREYIGEGSIDIAAYIAQLPKDTVCSIELPNLAEVAKNGYQEHVKHCIDSAKKYFVGKNL